MAFIGNNPTDVPLTGSQIANGTIVNANVATNTLNLTQKVTSTLPVANGGTGLTSLGTAGQALVVNSGATALEYSTVGAQAGQVIQVVSATDTSNRSTTSASFVTASNTLSVSITPSSTANKIFIIVNHYVYNTTGGNFYTIYRGSTNLGGSDGISYYNTGNGFETATCYFIYDSPSTTSATTYQPYIKVSGGTGYIGISGFKASIVAMEIKG